MNKPIRFMKEGSSRCPHCGNTTKWKIEHTRGSRTFSPGYLEYIAVDSQLSSEGPTTSLELRVPCDNCGLMFRSEAIVPSAK